MRVCGWDPWGRPRPPPLRRRRRRRDAAAPPPPPAVSVIDPARVKPNTGRSLPFPRRILNGGLLSSLSLLGSSPYEKGVARAVSRPLTHSLH